MPTIQDIRKLRRNGAGIAEIARETGVSEPTIRKYLKEQDFSPKMPVKKQFRSILDPYKPAIDAWLEEDRGNWHKQRHTAKRIWERLVQEEGAIVSYNTVQRYVKIYKDTHKDHRDEYLDQDWPPGEVQVDFGQADFRIVGVRTRMHHLVVDFPYSNVGIAQVFPGESAECVCEGLKTIFAYVGGVPRRLVFDNATGVGRRVCGIIRTSKLFSSFAAHYGFGYSFCNPNSGNEKGGVENKVGALRRHLFVPVPQFDNLALYNKRLMDRCMEHSRKEHYRKGEQELHLFEEDCFALLPLPGVEFSAVSYTRHVADKYGNICLGTRHRYSSDPSFGRRELLVGTGAFQVFIYDPQGTLIATHPRAYGDKPTESIDPVSQLALLCRKPGGWPDSRVRSSLPDNLRQWLDDADIPDRNRTLRILRDVTEESGYHPAAEALERIIGITSNIDHASVSVLADGIANGRSEVTYDEQVDMTPYDEVFSLVTGGDTDAG